MEGRQDITYGLGAIVEAYQPIIAAKEKCATDNYSLNMFYDFIDKLSIQLYQLPSQLSPRAKMLGSLLVEMQAILGQHDIMRISNPNIRNAFIETVQAIENYISAITPVPPITHKDKMQGLHQMGQLKLFISPRVTKPETTPNPDIVPKL